MKDQAPLHEQALLWTRAFESAEIGIVLIDQATDAFIDVNPAFAAQRGYERPEMIGMTLFELYPPEEREELRRSIQQIVSAKDHGIIERQHMRKDGSRFPVRLDFTVIRDAEGKATTRVVFSQDLTERKRAEVVEAKLRETEMRFRFALDHSPLILTNQDRELRFTWVHNQHPAFPTDQVLGKTEAELLPENEAGPLMALKRRVLETGIPVNEQVRVSIGGKVYFYELSVEALRDEQGNIVGVSSASIDISERIRALEEKHLRDQLAQAQRMEAIGRLAGGVAHDFNNMLGVILGQAELALHQVDAGHPLHRRLVEILNAAERSAKLTRQLLAFARKQTAVPRVIDLNETVQGMLTMLERLVGEDIELVYKPGASVWPVCIDPTQIDQILANLCVNARDAIEGVGTIVIETGNIRLEESDCAGNSGMKPGEYGMLSVSDSGRGMSKEVMEYIFEPFFTTKETGLGTGLGLATVHGIVTQNKGFVRVFSEAERGTVFKIYLPRCENKVEPEARENPPLAQAFVGNETVLIVEDEHALLQLMQGLLKEMGYTVLGAGSPGDAIRLSARHSGPIDLLITDVIMPEMNGRELSQRLLSFRPKLKRLYMSGYPADILAKHGMLDVGTSFVAKPFSRQEFAAQVRAALDKQDV